MQDLDFTRPPADLTPVQKPVQTGKAASMIGHYMVKKLRGQVEVAGTTRQAAKNLRKQGVPIDIALAVLVGAKVRS